MKKRLAAAVLCITVLISSIPMLSAANTTGETLNTLLGNYETSGTVTFEQGATVDGLSDGAVITAEGLQITNGGITYTTSAPLAGELSAVELRVKTTNGFQYQITAGTNERAYGQFAPGNSGCWLNKSSGAIYVTADAELFGAWVDLLWLRKGTGVEVYCKPETGAEYTLLISVSDLRSGSGMGGIWLKDIGTPATTSVKFIKMYKGETGEELGAILGNYYKASETAFTEGATVDGLSSGATINADGLLVGEGITYATATPLAETGGAVELRVKTTNGFQYQMNAGNSNRAYGQFAPGDSGCWLNKLYNKAAYATADDGLFGVWVDLMVVRTATDMKVYCKKAAGTRYSLITSVSLSELKEGHRDGIWLHDGTNSTSVKSIKMYKSYTGVSFSEAVGGVYQTEMMDFAPTASIEGVPDTAVMGESGLNVPTTGVQITKSTPLSATGGAVEMRVKSANGFFFQIKAGNSTRIYSKIDRANCFLNKASGAAYATADADMFDQWIDLLIVREDPGAKIYYKRADAEQYKLFLTAETIQGNFNAGFYFADTNGGTSVDWIKMYAPLPTSPKATQPTITVSGGNATAKATILSSSTATATLLFARYDAQGLAECKVAEGTVGTSKTVTVMLPSVDGSTYRAFVLENLNTIIPLNLSGVYAEN